MTRTSPCLPLVLACLLGACQTVHRKRPRTPEAALVQRAVPVRLWNAVEQRELVGEVVRYESQVDGSPLFVVRNRWRQDLGVIDRLGRAYRFRPHTEDPEWLGTGTVREGAARILEAASLELREVALLEAQAPSFDTWSTAETRIEEAAAARETDSPVPSSSSFERGAEVGGNPQSREGTRSKDRSDDPPSSPDRG